MALEGGSGCIERVLILTSFADTPLRKQGEKEEAGLKNAVQTFSDSCSPVFCRFRCLCSKLLPFRHMFC